MVAMATNILEIHADRMRSPLEVLTSHRDLTQPTQLTGWTRIFQVRIQRPLLQKSCRSRLLNTTTAVTLLLQELAPRLLEVCMKPTSNANLTLNQLRILSALTRAISPTLLTPEYSQIHS
jgi:hypothetical protein